MGVQEVISDGVENWKWSMEDWNPPSNVPLVSHYHSQATLELLIPPVSTNKQQYVLYKGVSTLQSPQVMLERDVAR